MTPAYEASGGGAAATIQVPYAPRYMPITSGTAFLGMKAVNGDGWGGHGNFVKEVDHIAAITAALSASREREEGLRVHARTVTSLLDRLQQVADMFRIWEECETADGRLYLQEQFRGLITQASAELKRDGAKQARALLRGTTGKQETEA